MRSCLLAIVPLALAAAPASAARAPIGVPPELSDPKFVERITAMTESLSKALLDVPVGEIEAAAEGRAPTDADRNRTIGDVGRVSRQDLERQIARARPQLEAAMQALARTLPAMTEALSKAAEEVERATANLPQPGYPRR